MTLSSVLAKAHCAALKNVLSKFCGKNTKLWLNRCSNYHRFASVPLDLCLPPIVVLYRHTQHCFVHSVAVSLGRPNSVNIAGPSQSVKMPDVKPFERLPDAVKPQHYTLSLTPNLKTFQFQGDVTINIEVLKATNKIVLNALDLKLNEVILKNNNESTLPKNINLIADDEKAEFIFEKALEVGSYALSISFTGEINDKMKGFYRSKYTNEKGEEIFAAVTQFEPTDARRCFPCWDEPAHKSTFDISLTVPPSLVALSNMPVKNSTTAGDLVRYEFERTPIMSTYLVAAVIGEYDYVEGKSTDGVLVRVYTPKGKKEQGQFALEVAVKVLPYYKDYFNIAYPLPKIDLIAIADFSAGAMENWGLVTYRETCLLVDPENTSAVRKQWIALVVGHELAHQWFGNLVTMEWWTDLWLNEGYASFVEFLCVNHLFPNYDIWTQFVNDIFIKALELDSLQNSHPIEVPVGHPSEIDEIFDDISYSKGASVIRMLHHYIGDKDFRKGMNLYLTRHQYKNTSTQDLWTALEEASKKPVGDIMSTWTKQTGFPVVSVSEKSDESGYVLNLKQRRFVVDPDKSHEKYHWIIPIAVSSSASPEDEIASTLLKGAEDNLYLPSETANGWVKINPGTIGYYRTQYPPEMLEKFIPAIHDKSMPPLDRLGLVDDLFAMVQAGHTNTVEVLKLMKAYENEDDYTVWSSICNILGKLSVLLSHTECEDDYAKYQRDLLKSICEKLGWDPKPNETHLNTMLRGLIMGRLALLDDNSITSEAQKRFQQHIGSGPTLSADLRSPVYKAVLRAGDMDIYNQLLKMYRSADLHEEKDRISRALGASKDPELLKKVLDFAMSDEVRSQDTVFVIMSVAMTKYGRKLAWDFFKDNFKTLIDRYRGGFLLARLVKFTTENFASMEMAEEVENFFKVNTVPGTERTVQQAIESIHLNVSWLKRDGESIKKYLKNY